MSLIKTHLLDTQRQKEAIEESKQELLEYKVYGSLSPTQPGFGGVWTLGRPKDRSLYE
tara:strand:+ start:506 stop:679 length:174 start_codon:yes stop_codon:yes gene_type:complete